MTEPRDLRDPRAPVDLEREKREAEQADRTPIATALRAGARRLGRAVPDKMATPGIVRGYQIK